MKRYCNICGHNITNNMIQISLLLNNDETETSMVDIRYAGGILEYHLECYKEVAGEEYIPKNEELLGYLKEY